MKPRNREITIFNISMLDVISGAVGAFLILMVVLFPSYQRTYGETEKEVGQAEKRNTELRAQLAKLEKLERLDEVQLQQDRRSLEQELRQVGRSIQSAKQIQKRRKSKPGTSKGGKGLGLVTLFAKWEAPLNSPEFPQELSVFLIPGTMGLEAARKPEWVTPFCRQAIRQGPPQGGHLTAAYARKSAVVVNRTNLGFYAVLYCRPAALQQVNPGPELEVAGHLNYGLKLTGMPSVKVPIGGTIGGFVTLNGENVQYETLEEVRAKQAKRGQKRRSQGTLMTGMEELMKSGKKNPGPRVSGKGSQPK